MTFNSLDEIIGRFGFSKHEGIKEIRSHLTSIIRETHPDATGGKYESTKQENDYLAARGAADFVDSQRSDLAVFKDKEELDNYVGTIVKSRTDELEVKINALQSHVDKAADTSAHQKNLDKITQLESEAAKNVQQASEKFRLPKYVPFVTVALLVPVLVAIWALPQRINDNPTLNEVIDTQSLTFTYIWLGIAGLILLVWGASWFIELRYQSKYALYATESTQEMLYQKFRKFFGGTFQKAYLTKFIYLYQHPNKVLEELVKKLQQITAEAKRTRQQLDKSHDDYAQRIREIDAERARQSLEVFKEFENYQITPVLFPQVFGVIELEIAEQIAEIIIQRGLLRESFEDVSSHYNNSVDAWYA